MHSGRPGSLRSGQSKQRPVHGYWSAQETQQEQKTRQETWYIMRHILLYIFNLHFTAVYYWTFIPLICFKFFNRYWLYKYFVNCSKLVRRVSGFGFNHQADSTFAWPWPQQSRQVPNAHPAHWEYARQNRRGVHLLYCSFTWIARVQLSNLVGLCDMTHRLASGPEY